ncbi:MAG: NAD(P)-binding domain-containing protein [Planctomycetota bacterium]
MNDILMFSAALVGLLIVVAVWQRLVDKRAAEQTRHEIAEAERRGSAKPLAQHPQINEWSCIGCGACVRACPEDGVLEVIDGIARIVHGSRCVGHERCAVACPVGAIKVGLGDISGRDDIPRLREDTGESSVPGLFLAGEVSGIALIRHAVRQGTSAVEEIARRIDQLRGRNDGKAVDVAIVGAGPAGLAAALKAIEAGLSYLVIEQEDVGGTILHYPRQKLVMTNPVTLPLYGKINQAEFQKEDLLALWTDVIKKHQVKIKPGIRFTGVTGAAGNFVLDTTAGKLAARSTVLAVGRRGTPRKLEVPGEELSKVSYRLLDAGTYRHRKLLVVGGGDSAVEAAVGLAEQPGNVVHLSYRKEHFVRIKSRNEKKLEEAVQKGRLRLVTKSYVKEISPTTVTLQVDGQPAPLELPNEFVFVFAGGVAPFDLLKAAGVRFGDAS